MILIAGPCIIEDFEMLEETLETLLETIRDLDVDFYFKSSCVKDNRTNVENYRGVGFLVGLDWLEKLRKKYNIRICTDFHTPKQIKQFGNRVDLIQIPAYLCQQTSLMEEAVKTKKRIHIKKGQFLGPTQFMKLLKKYRDAGCKNIIATDRGTSLGYNGLFMDPRHVKTMWWYGAKICVDITHPNKFVDKKEINVYNNAYSIAMGYIAAGVDGIFLETHPNPQKALCDSQTMIPLDIAKKWIKKFYRLYEIIREERLIDYN